MDKMLIKEIYEIVDEKTGESLSPLEQWYNDLINKKAQSRKSL